MAKQNLYAHIILDRSGSMHPIRRKAVSAVNEYIWSLSNDHKLNARVSVTFFHQRYSPAVGSFEGTHTPHRASEMVISHPIWNEKTRNIPYGIHLEDYVPDGGTPLLDAIGTVNTMISERKLRKHERHALVIMTDGFENASREFNRANIASILKNRQELDNWLVLFLGANMDAVAEGATMGTVAANTLTFGSQHIQQTGALAAKKTRAYGASGMSMDAAFTDDERTEAIKPKSEAEA